MHSRSANLDASIETNICPLPPFIKAILSCTALSIPLNYSYTRNARSHVCERQHSHSLTDSLSLARSFAHLPTLSHTNSLSLTHKLTHAHTRTLSLSPFLPHTHKHSHTGPRSSPGNQLKQTPTSVGSPANSGAYVSTEIFRI